MSENEISKVVVNAALTVHKNLGPGLLESVYENCLAHELKKSSVEFKQQPALPVVYEDVKLDIGFRLDLWVENKLIIEIKAVEALNDVHMAQMLTYLKLTDNKLGLLINFNVALIKHGIKRVINGY